MRVLLLLHGKGFWTLRCRQECDGDVSISPYGCVGIIIASILSLALAFSMDTDVPSSCKVSRRDTRRDVMGAFVPRNLLNR